MSETVQAIGRTIGIDLGRGDDATALVVAVSWPDGAKTLDSAILTADERLGLLIVLGDAGPLSYNDALRGTQALEALLIRKGLDARELGHAFMDYRAGVAR